jgi:hypothetical protein
MTSVCSLCPRMTNGLPPSRLAFIRAIPSFADWHVKTRGLSLQYRTDFRVEQTSHLEMVQTQPLNAVMDGRWADGWITISWIRISCRMQMRHSQEMPSSCSYRNCPVTFQRTSQIKPQNSGSTGNCVGHEICVRFEVVTAVTMKNVVVWDVTPCGSCKN